MFVAENGISSASSRFTTRGAFCLHIARSVAFSHVVDIFTKRQNTANYSVSNSLHGMTSRFSKKQRDIKDRIG
jgi:hypothetical protein